MGFPGSEKLDLSEWILIDQHTFGGQAGPDGAGGAGGSGKNSSYNVIDVVESSDEENYMDTFGWKTFNLRKTKFKEQVLWMY